MLISIISNAQQTTKTCSLYGKITDNKTHEEVPFASIILYKNDTSKVAVSTSDINGDYCFKNISTGKYKLSVVYVGYNKHDIKNIVFNANSPTKIDIQLATNNIKLDEVQVISYSTPAIDGDMKSSETVTREEYQNMPTRTVSKQGYLKKEKSITIRGGRSTSVQYNTEEYHRIYENEYKDSKKDPP